MIHIRFMGSFGNQMFQYAAARLAAERLRTRFLVSQGTFAWGDTLKGRPTIPLFKAFPRLDPGFAARCLNLGERYAPRYLQRMERRLFRHEFRPWVPDSAPWEGLEGYDERYERVDKFTRLIGYFQSPKYLQDHEARVRAWYTDPPGVAAGIAERWRRLGIDPSAAVAVHVRLSDYRRQAPLGSTSEGGWVLNPDYYRKALDAIGAGGGHGTLVLFSDEPDVAEDYLGRSADHVSRTGDTFVDFRMMSSCRRMIIANSTYSWWAAWLNPHPDKQIVAPEFFLGRNLGTWYPKDIRVDGWQYV